MLSNAVKPIMLGVVMLSRKIYITVMLSDAIKLIIVT